jgi:hypothetical protein
MADVTFLTVLAVIIVAQVVFLIFSGDHRLQTAAAVDRCEVATPGV